MKNLKKLLEGNEEVIMKTFFAMEMAEKGVSKALEDNIKMIDETPRDEIFDEEDSDSFMLRQEVDAKLSHICWALMYKKIEEEEEETSKIIVKELRKCADKLEKFYSNEKNK